MEQKCTLERIIIDLVCSWRSPVSRFIDVSFTIVVYE